MLTTGDIKKLIDSFSAVFATKQNLEQVREEIKDFRNDAFDKMDAVYKEVKDMRQEQAFLTQHNRDIQEEIELIKKRINTSL